MKIIKHAESKEDDSIAYALINLQWCLPLLEERKFRIDYYRNEETVQENQCVKRDFSFDDIEAAHPGLCEALIATFPESNSAGNQQAVSANLIAAYLFGSYVDLRENGTVATDYPYVAKVMSVNTYTNPGSFDIACSAFDVIDVSDIGIPKIKIRSYILQTVNAAQVDSIWPDSSKIAPMMEALGYTPYEVVAHLNRSLLNPGASFDAEAPDFDISVD